MEPDLYVQIVDDADTKMQVVGDQVLDIAGASDGDVVKVQGGQLITESADAPDLSAYITKATADAQSVLGAVADDMPIAIAIPASRFFGRKATGDVGPMTVAEAKTLLALAATDLSDFGTVTATTQADSYTLALADKGTVVEATKATAMTITIPTNATVAFPVGTVIEIYQSGAGQVTVAAAGGVTLRAPNGAKTARQYGTVSLRKRATDEWVLSGDAAT